MEDGFEENSRVAVDELINDALPGYITHRLVQIVTDTLVKEITGQNTPIMRELVAGLAEVYCLTDPTQTDNPIVFASEGMLSLAAENDTYLLTPLRVLQMYSIRQRLCHRAQLSFLARSKVFRRKCHSSDRCTIRRSGDLRDNIELVSLNPHNIVELKLTRSTADEMAHHS